MSPIDLARRTELLLRQMVNGKSASLQPSAQAGSRLLTSARVTHPKPNQPGMAQHGSTVQALSGHDSGVFLKNRPFMTADPFLVDLREIDKVGLSPWPFRRPTGQVLVVSTTGSSLLFRIFRTCLRIYNFWNWAINWPVDHFMVVSTNHP